MVSEVVRIAATPLVSSERCEMVQGKQWHYLISWYELMVCWWDGVDLGTICVQNHLLLLFLILRLLIIHKRLKLLTLSWFLLDKHAGKLLFISNRVREVLSNNKASLNFKRSHTRCMGCELNGPGDSSLNCLTPPWMLSTSWRLRFWKPSVKSLTSSSITT